MDSIQHPTAVDRRSSFREGCETAHRRESGGTETDTVVFDHEAFAPNYIRGSLSDLCNVHCSHLQEAYQVCNRRPGVVENTVDGQSFSNTSNGRVREDAHETKRRAIIKASPVNGEVTASLGSVKNLMRRLSPSSPASEHGTQNAADDVTGVDGQRNVPQSRYVYFEREKESDYTRGPIRMISASDRIDNSCAARLLNLEFSDSIKQAIETQRKLDNEIRVSQKQGETMRVLLEKLDEKLYDYHCRQVDLVRGATGASSEGLAALEKQFPKISKKIGDLESRKREEAADEQHRQTCLQARYKDFLEAQRVVNCYLESAFVDAGLMPPSAERVIETPTASGRVNLYHDRKYSIMPGLPADALSRQDRVDTTKLQVSLPDKPHRAKLQKRQKANTGRLDAVNSMVSVWAGGLSLHYSAETTATQDSSPQVSGSMETDPVITSPESVVGLNLHGEYVRAKRRLNWAQWEFDLRDATREREQYWNDRDLRRSGGTEGLPQEQFICSGLSITRSS